MHPSYQNLQALYGGLPVSQYMLPNPYISPNIALQAQFHNLMTSFPPIHPSMFSPAVPLSPYLQYGYNTPYLPKLDQNSSTQAIPAHYLKSEISSQFVKSEFVDRNSSGTITSPNSSSSKDQPPSPDAQSASSLKVESKFLLELPADPEIRLEAQIKYMVQFFVANAGKISQKEMRQAKAKYEDDPQLLAVFNALQAKYSATTKSREEMIKWVVRKSLKTTKKNLKKNQTDGDKKNLMNELCKKYFANPNENDSDDDLVDSMLPFRKNSKNKTMNSTFVTEIFQSEGFKEDYKEFLKQFDEIAEAENSDKIRRFTQTILECAKKDKFNAISKYRRIPWLKVWIQNTKVLAEELHKGDFVGKSSRKVKLC